MAAKFAQPDAFSQEDTGLLPAGAPGDVHLPTAGRHHRAVPGTAVSLCSHEPSNYGSLLFRVLPKLATVEALGLDRGLPVVAWAEQRCVPGRAGPVRRGPAQRLGAARASGAHGIWPPACPIACATRTPSWTGPSHALCSASPCASGGDQGSAGRGGSTCRAWARPAAARPAACCPTRRRWPRALSALGFEVFEPEAHSPPKDQVAAFASADVVVGPAGSGMFNTMAFCRPGTKVLDMESEVHWVYAHAGLFASCQLRYGLFLGLVDAADPNPVHRRWTANVPALVSRVSAWM